MSIASINPATGEKLKEFPAFSDSEIEKRLELAEHAFSHHRQRPFAKRAQLMMATAAILDQDKDKLISIMCQTCGTDDPADFVTESELEEEQS